MTAKARAKEIAERLMDAFMGKTFDDVVEVQEWLENRIAKALESFAADAVKEALSERGKLVNQIVYEEARNEALEECAKVVENYPVVSPISSKAIAAQIRARGGK